MSETEHREPVDLAPIRRRFERFRRYEDAAGGPLTGEEHVNAIAAAWDVEPLLDEVRWLRNEVENLRVDAGNARAALFHAEALIERATGDLVAAGWQRAARQIRADRDQWVGQARAADRAAAGGGAGNPTEDQPPPATCGRPGCYGAGPGYEVRAHTVRCEQCEEAGGGDG